MFYLFKYRRYFFMQVIDVTTEYIDELEITNTSKRKN